jgi:hypothetical protein
VADNPPATAKFRIRQGAIAAASLAWPTVNPPLSVVKTGCGSRAQFATPERYKKRSLKSGTTSSNPPQQRLRHRITASARWFCFSRLSSGLSVLQNSRYLHQNQTVDVIWLFRCSFLMHNRGMTSLKQRFQRFMLSTPGVESIDDLVRPRESELTGRKRADFLACDRRVVIETKSLDIDPVEKIQRFLDGLAQAGRLPKSGDMTLEELLRDLPDGQALYDELRARVTKVLDDNIAKADDQTRDTKDIFTIPEAIGVVVILNENAPLLYPDQSTLRIFEVLRKLRAGELRYVHNHVVIYISEAHIVDAGDGVTMFDMATVYSDAGNATPFAMTFAEDLNRRWATFNGAGYLESSELWDNFRARDSVKPFNVVRPLPKNEEPVIPSPGASPSHVS